MVSAPLPVVSSRDAQDDEAECPVCLEPLSFSFRLPGEKPHIVPECGHALHEACFTAVYGPPPSQSRSQGALRKSNLGVCGVCRRPMKVGDGDGGKSNKLAALTGMGDPTGADSLFPGRETPTVRGTVSHAPRNGLPAVRPYDPNEDDPVEHLAHSAKSATEHAAAYVVAPSIQVRSEFSSITRNLAEPTQALTCIVVVELPSKRQSSHVPGPVIPDAYHRRPTPDAHPTPTYRQHHSDASADTVRRHAASPTTPSVLSPSLHSSHDPYARSLDDAPPHQDLEEPSPFQSITEDLKNRIIDWKGHPLSGLGPLRLFDLLSVRRDSLVREFYVYLFKEAIICVAEEKKRSLGRFLTSGAAGPDAAGAGGATQPKGVLRLKGRIYIRHIRQVTDTTVAGELSLTIDMEDERLDSFILIFKDRPSLETWRSNINALVTYVPRPPPEQAQFEHGLDMEEFGGSAKAARMLSGSTGTTASSDRDSLLHPSNRSTQSSYTSHHGSLAARGTGASHGAPKLAPLDEDEPPAPGPSTAAYVAPPPAPPLYAPHMSAGPSNGLTPLPHPPLDLLLILALPTAAALPATAALKLRVIKASLDFVLAALSARDRLSVVTFEVGMSGPVRKTPFLSVGRTQSRARLARFVDETGFRTEEGAGGFEDEFLVRGTKDEKTDVVTAVNHGLDVVLQRKSRNPITGMVLVSDTADSTRRAQMDLVLARAEAANVPIHSFGYGRAHDPASLWLMSNHTNGTYTFVKDWYDLRDCLAGCIGGMMSIGSTAMKLHMKIVDGNRFRIRKVSGGPSSIVASDGRNVDVDVGELRYGERKEMLVELELDNGDAPSSSAGATAPSRTRGPLNATDRFNQSLGLDALAIEETDLMDGMMDRMIDEVPVFEVDGAFFDPAAAKHVSRLAHPVLLTVTLLPPSSGAPARPPASASDPVIVRRRMELLASDMITRALVLVSRKNYPQAQKIMAETTRILLTVLHAVSSSLAPPPAPPRSRRETLALGAVRVLQAVLADMQVLRDALDENVELFAHDQRNFGAQQAMILRDQKAWTGRSATERVFWTVDNAIELVGRSTDWVARE
ncbi:Pleckstrin homology domain-containing protein [Vararia minispora EC-137]|uniref:Pleckstrin homology domain-containing protein n=1 Tax=Vararia minispora EC-137 TaxID=1314806 RepID=A0ACB8Q4B4_9AGAM|nr:Pleckstrin homology domain-containing protein [Vararia minispora EC-137]